MGSIRLQTAFQRSCVLLRLPLVSSVPVRCLAHELCAFALKPEGNEMRDEHPISLRLKIRPELVEGLDKLRKTNGLSMNEAVNVAIANALAAKENMNDRTQQ